MSREVGSVAIAIPTKNRPEDLDGTVKTLLSQTILPNQLVIVDQSIDDESYRRVQSRIARLPGDLRHSLELVYIRDVSLSGASAARNCALAAIRSDIVLFLDDDVLLEEDFIHEVLETYKRYPDATGVSGIISNFVKPAVALRYWTWVFVRGALHDDRQSLYLKAHDPDLREPVRVSRFGGGLMSIRMSAIGNIRFDENLTGACDGEDVDFTVRLGPDAILLIAPKARLEHKKTPAARVDEHWLYRDCRTTWYLYRRNWNHGVWNRLCFLWLNVGYGVAAAMISIRRVSLFPWKELLKAVRKSRELVEPSQQVKISKCT